MPIQALEPFLVLGLTLLFLGLLFELGRFTGSTSAPIAARRKPRPLRPRTPDDCPHGLIAEAVQSTTSVRTVVPYPQRKSTRGPLREKTIDSHGQACPNPDCLYYGSPATPVPS